MATAAAPSAPASEGIPEIPMSEGDDMAEVLDTLKQKIAELEAKLNAKESPAREYDDLLKPIDIKDIEKPKKDDVMKFSQWFDRFRNLLTNRHANWYKFFKIVEPCGFG